MKRGDGRSFTSVALYNLRIRAIAILKSGRTQIDTAKLLGVSRQAVARWANSAEKNGLRNLKPRQRGRPKGGKLKDFQMNKAITYILKFLPDQLKLPFYLWTREAIVSLIKKKFKIKLSVWTIGRLLKQFNLTPQRPARRAYERNPKEVRLWLKKEYPKIKAKARREKAIIIWLDEMGLRSDAPFSRTYGLKGKTPIVNATGKRFKCSMIAGITNRGKLFFMVFKKRFIAGIFIVFLGRLIKQVKRKIFLVTDAHPVHRASKTKKWLKRNAHKIQLYFLPPYSPDLNPSEYLNQDVKSNTIRKIRPENQNQMMTYVRKYLRSRQRDPKKVISYFQAKPVRYAFL